MVNKWEGCRLLNCIMILSASKIKEQRHHAEREPVYQQIGTRYIDDPDWGYTFLNVE